VGTSTSSGASLLAAVQMSFAAEPLTLTSAFQLAMEQKPQQVILFL